MNFFTEYTGLNVSDRIKTKQSKEKIKSRRK